MHGRRGEKSYDERYKSSSEEGRQSFIALYNVCIYFSTLFSLLPSPTLSVCLPESIRYSPWFEKKKKKNGSRHYLWFIIYIRDYPHLISLFFLPSSFFFSRILHPFKDWLTDWDSLPFNPQIIFITIQIFSFLRRFIRIDFIRIKSSFFFPPACQKIYSSVLSPSLSLCLWIVIV